MSAWEGYDYELGGTDLKAIGTSNQYAAFSRSAQHFLYFFPLRKGTDNCARFGPLLLNDVGGAGLYLRQE